MEMHRQPYVEITEQAASRGFRFRYESEKGTHGSILGVSSTATDKTYPKIKIHGNITKGYVIVSCVTENQPHRTHPHRIFSKEGKVSHGVSTIIIKPGQSEIEFQSLGIQCVKLKDLNKSLEERKIIRVDPFRQGFDHIRNASKLNLNAVRLCFQVVLLDPITKSMQQLAPVVSNPIYDKQGLGALVICKLSSNIASAAGGDTLMVFCEKIPKNDIQVRFFEEQYGRIVWEAFGNFRSESVFEQSVIVLSTPPYCNTEIMDCVSIRLQLIKPSTGELGKSVSFQLIPSHWEMTRRTYDYIERSLKRKRDNILNIDLLNHPNRASCGCILGPIINPYCPIHNPVGACENRPMNNEDTHAYAHTQTGYKLFYHNVNSTSEETVPVTKRMKHSEELALVMKPAMSSTNPFHDNASAPPTVHGYSQERTLAMNSAVFSTKSFGNNGSAVLNSYSQQYNFQYAPVEAQGYQAFPQAPQGHCIYDYSVPRNSTNTSADTFAF